MQRGGGSSSRGRLVLFLFLSVWCGVDLARADTDPTNFQAAAVDAGYQELQSELSEAASAFRAGDFERAQSNFQHAAELTDDPSLLRDIRFNIGVCRFEQGDYDGAERVFASLAEETLAERRAEAWLHAGFAAIRLGALERAQQHLAAAEPKSSEEMALARRLQDQLQRAREQARTANLRARLEEGMKHLAEEQHREYKNAERCFADVLAAAGEHDVRVRAVAHHGLAAVFHARGALDDALEQLDAAVALEPENPDFRVSRARVRAERNEREEALVDYQTALAVLCERESSDCTELRQEARGVYALPLGGWGLSLSSSAGYDSNVTQSGSAFSIGAGPEGVTEGSPFVDASAGVGYHLRPSDLWALSPSYGFAMLAFLDLPARQLSLMTHRLGLKFERAVSANLRGVLDGGLRYAASGLEDPTGFTVDGYAGAGVSWDSSPQSSFGADFEYRRRFGLNGQEYLGGHLFDGSLFQFWSRGPLRLGSALGWRTYLVGTQSLWLGVGGMRCAGGFAFAGDCYGGVYQVPLSYLGPNVAVSAEVKLARRWFFDLRATFEYRYYLTPSVLQAGPGPGGGYDAFERRRQDVRPGASLRLLWEPSWAGGGAGFARYSINVVSSNIDRDVNDPAHALDYAQLSYVQHIPELGLAWQY